MQSADSGPTANYANVPTVDVGPFVHSAGHPPAAREAVVQRVLDVVTQIGFMNVVGHGVPDTLVANTVAVAREFFAQSIDLKLRSTSRVAQSLGYSVRGEKAYHTEAARAGGHFKEIFDLGPPAAAAESPFPRNVYPASPERFRAVLDAYYAEMERVEALLFRVLSIALGRVAASATDADFFERATGRHRGLLRINYYPQCHFVPGAGALRDGAHTDWTPITILFVEKEGLEVMEVDAWRRVPMQPGAFIVNVGDQLHRWSNGRFRSSLHRVDALDCRNSSRISVAYFATECVDPTDDAVIAPVCAPGESPRFEPVVIRDYLLGNFGSLQSRASGV